MKKEIIIDGQQSDWYEKAIFVLKDEVNNPPLEYKLSSYADELVENYLKKIPRAKVMHNKTLYNRNHKTSKLTQSYIDLFFYFSILSAIIAVILLGISLFS